MTRRVADMTPEELEARRARDRERYRQNREAKITKVKEWQAANPEKKREHVKTWRRRNPGYASRQRREADSWICQKMSERSAAWQRRQRRLGYNREWRRQNLSRERLNAYQRAYRARRKTEAGTAPATP